jgi:3-hydroxyacyl-[acyl-carrier-protein] dehydratase
MNDAGGRMLQAELDKILMRDSLRLVQPLPAVWQAAYALREDFAAFRGHFPDYPILPAFVQICMAQHILFLALKRELALTRVSVAKFTGRAGPGVNLQVSCSAVTGVSDGAQGWDCVLRVCGQEKYGNVSMPDISKFRLFFRN